MAGPTSHPAAGLDDALYVGSYEHVVIVRRADGVPLGYAAFHPFRFAGD